MAQHSADELAQAVVARLADCPNPRFKQVMTALIEHAHAFVREVDLKPDEWMAAIQFLTATGQKCDAKRQEFILLSDTLGISMLVVALEQLRGARAVRAMAQPGDAPPTEATVQGPFYWEGSPEFPLGGDVTAGAPGEPAYYTGTVKATNGKAIANCCLDVWSGDGEGVYDMQRGPDAGMRLRGRIRTDAQGGYRFWSIKPAYYPVPVDGPVGGMLQAMGRHANRPGHIHMMVYADGYQRLTTHLFDRECPYLDSDAVFGVRNSLIVDFAKHPAGKAPDGRVLNKPYYSTNFDFKLVPAA